MRIDTDTQHGHVITMTLDAWNDTYTVAVDDQVTSFSNPLDAARRYTGERDYWRDLSTMHAFHYVKCDVCK